MEIKVSICSFLPLLPPQNIMADQHVTTQNPACLCCRVETSSFHSHKPMRNTFFSPCFLLPLCEFARLHLSSGTRRANSFLRAPGFSLFGWMDLGSREGDFWPHTSGRKWLMFKLCFKSHICSRSNM